MYCSCTFVRRYLRTKVQRTFVFYFVRRYFRTLFRTKVLSYESTNESRAYNYFTKYHTSGSIFESTTTTTVQSIDLTFVRKYESTLYESTFVRKYESTFEGSVRVHVRVVRDGLELSLFAIRSTQLRLRVVVLYSTTYT